MKKLLIAAVILAAAVACGEASSSSQGHQPLALSDGTAQQAPDKSTAAVPPGQTISAPNPPPPMPIQGPLVLRPPHLPVSVSSGSLHPRLHSARQLAQLAHGPLGRPDR